MLKMRVTLIEGQVPEWQRPKTPLTLHTTKHLGYNQKHANTFPYGKNTFMKCAKLSGYVLF